MEPGSAVANASASNAVSGLELGSKRSLPRAQLAPRPRSTGLIQRSRDQQFPPSSARASAGLPHGPPLRAASKSLRPGAQHPVRSAHCKADSQGCSAEARSSRPIQQHHILISSQLPWPAHGAAHPSTTAGTPNPFARILIRDQLVVFPGAVRSHRPSVSPRNHAGALIHLLHRTSGSTRQCFDTQLLNRITALRPPSRFENAKTFLIHTVISRIEVVHPEEPTLREQARGSSKAA